MQRSISSMIGYAIRATDGDLGKVDASTSTTKLGLSTILS